MKPARLVRRCSRPGRGHGGERRSSARQNQRCPGTLSRADAILDTGNCSPTIREAGVSWPGCDGQYLRCDVETVKAVLESIRGPKSGPINTPHSEPIPPRDIGSKRERQDGGADEQEVCIRRSSDKGGISATIAVALFRPK